MNSPTFPDLHHPYLTPPITLSSESIRCLGTPSGIYPPAEVRDFFMFW
ncbi:hypothetical protein HMPREF0294_1887 [Corynebacterium glucuronolyticum ATCC 51867]|uniref:Uncharacterized protein n=1 Tax=Corynebacterium glucuronolyticum ATCC 51866 TaxID=548478 RepID=A0ABM9XPI4_9CORY|nr:hypothetical protein HMPREF0294_1887 [Corynebacterium glucuronolyticum ATCC 51867]EEI63068.1 hypothetical protein HMPREF0293_1586 [Corynebacterium glucuronolyticum ATCC 51866]